MNHRIFATDSVFLGVGAITSNTPHRMPTGFLLVSDSIQYTMQFYHNVSMIQTDIGATKCRLKTVFTVLVLVEKITFGPIYGQEKFSTAISQIWDPPCIHRAQTSKWKLFCCL